MLFSVLDTALQIKMRSCENFSPSSPNSRHFRLSSGQSLVAGGYQKAGPYSVEALLLYIMCKLSFSEDIDTDAWMLIGIAARLAIRLGYHRDPSHLPNISTFTGEIRRRIFFVVELFDMLLSFIVGLPAIIQEDENDAEPPRNLLDSDFDEDSSVLPASRPITDPTPMLYYCYKGRLGKSFRRVTRHALSLKGSSSYPESYRYEETMRLDAELHEVHANIPPSLKMKPLRQSYLDSFDIVQGRVNTNLMYLESLCVLHRKYLTYERSNPKYDYCRRTCVHAALELLDNQAELHSAMQPGGLFQNGLLMSNSLSLHGYLLAAMIMCLELYETHKEKTTLSVEEVVIQMKRYDALKHSHEIWLSRTANSLDARRASKILGTMLGRVPRPSHTSASTAHSLVNADNFVPQPDVLSNTAPSSGTSSWMMTALQDQQIQPTDLPTPNSFSADSVNHTSNMSENFDWVSREDQSRSIILISPGPHRSISFRVGWIRGG